MTPDELVKKFKESALSMYETDIADVANKKYKELLRIANSMAEGSCIMELEKLLQHEHVCVRSHAARVLLQFAPKKAEEAERILQEIANAPRTTNYKENREYGSAKRFLASWRRGTLTFPHYKE